MYNILIKIKQYKKGRKTMANIFERMGLVERRYDDEVVAHNISNSTYEQPLTISQIDIAKPNEVKAETLIQDIYQENNLSDSTKSIFKVEEFSNTLPKEMRTETKKATVLGIMNVSGLTVDEVVKDGVSRIETLDAVKEKIITDSETKVANANNEIEQLKAKIEELEKLVAVTLAEKEQSDKLICDEIEHIMDLINFISGGDK